MRSIQEKLGEFSSRGIPVVAISVDPAGRTRELTEKRGYTFTFLSDEKASTIRRYDVLHAHGGFGGTEIARPAEFLLDATGIVRWRNLTENVRVREKGEDLLKVIDELGLGKTTTGR